MAATNRKAIKIPMISSIRAQEGEATLRARGEASRWVPIIEETREGPSVEAQDTKRRRRGDSIELFMTHLSPRTTRSRRRKQSTKMLAMEATSAESETLTTTRIQPHTLITTISNKIHILEEAIKISGDWDEANLAIIAETNNPIPMVECTINIKTQGTTTLMISSLPERAEAVAEDLPIRYMALRNSCLPPTRAEGSKLDTGEGSLCTNNMILIRIITLTAISSRITYRTSHPHLRNTSNLM